MAKPLAIIPTYLREALDLAMVEATIRTLRETAGDQCDVLIVDDGSPDYVAGLRALADRHDADVVAKSENEGFATTVNVGLHRALVEERDAVLVNADIEFGLTRNWLELMQRQRTSDGTQPASIVGALLLYPNGTIQHAGIYFSILSREFDHRYRYGPGNLPEARDAAICPVTGALQFISNECLHEVGVYDPSFRLGWEDVDYNVRVWLAGRECIYQPGIRAIHHESFFRGRSDEKIERWTAESWMRFCGKYADTSFAEFVPDVMAAAVG